MESGPPILLVHPERGTTRIAHCCASARAAGVHRGMAIEHARALLVSDDVVIEPFDAERERRALGALTAWAMRFTPVVASDPPDGVRLDITGCARLYGGERRLVNLIANAMEWLGFTVRVAVADTYGAAWALARYGDAPRRIVPPRETADALDALPLPALRLAPEAVEIFDDLGLETVDQLRALPRLELATRFDADVLRRLDQATGEAPEPIEPLRPRERPRVERIFAGPATQLEAISQTARDLLQELADILERRERGIVRLDLTLQRLDIPPEVCTIRCSHPTRRLPHLWALLAPRLERLHLGYGVEAMRMEATTHAPLRHTQLDPDWSGAADDDDGTAAGAEARAAPALGELLDTFATRWGSSRAYRAVPVASHLPERAVRFAPLAAETTHGRRADAEDAFDWSTPDERGGSGAPWLDDLLRTGRGPTALARAERPSLLFPHAEAIEVLALSPDGPPTWLRWREQGGAVRACLGPERIAGSWWDGPVRRARQTDEGDGATLDPTLHWRTRDYYRVQSESGTWLWIFRELETARWYVHGCWA